MRALLARSAAQARYAILGACLLLCAFQLIIVGQAAEIQRTQAFGRLADLVPVFLQRGLGNRVMLLATFRGTVAFGYFHPVVCLVVSVLAMYVASEPAHEIESGLVDLELSRALPRHRLLTRSLLLAAFTIAGAMVVMAIGTALGVVVFDAASMDLPSLKTRAQLLANLSGLAACFAAFALLVATMAKRWATAFTTATLTAVVFYLLDFLALAWPAMRRVAWISPFHYYRALAILAGDARLGRDVAVLIGVAAACAVAAYWRFARRDL